MFSNNFSLPSYNLDPQNLHIGMVSIADYKNIHFAPHFLGQRADMGAAPEKTKA